MLIRLFLVMLALTASTTVTACGAFCTDASLEARPASGTPLTFEAVLTSDGSPLSGARLAFYSLANGPSGEEGRLIGSGTTDSSGVGKLVVQGGRPSLEFPGATLTGYEITFDNLDKLNGVRYCSAKARGSLS